MLYSRYYPPNYLKNFTLNQYFNKIYFLNLDRRPDRKVHLENHLASLKIEAERFVATDGKSFPQMGMVADKPWIKGLEIACLISHENMLKRILEEGFKYTLIMEDDCIFDTNVQTKFAEYLVQLPEDWEMIYFGGNHGICSPTGKGAFKVSKNLLKIQFTLTTTCYGININVIPRLLEFIKDHTRQIDAYYAEFHSQSKSYCFTPHLAWQRTGFSDIQEMVVDYSFLK
jgi:GR25 family glycosyltransferase involved in LPS biosynthesis